MSDSALTLTGTFDNASIVTSPGITQKRDEAIAFAQQVPAILHKPEELKIAAQAFHDLREITKAVTNAASTIKRPIDALGTSILRCRDEFLDEAESLQNQIQGRINNYQRRIEEEAREAARVAEVQRKAAEAAAEKARQEAETIKAMPASTPEDVEEAELAVLKEELAAAPLPIVVPTVRGIASRPVLDFELKGRNEAEQQESLHAFAAAYPHLCKIELKRADILKKLNKEDCFWPQLSGPRPDDWLPEPPGLRVFRDVRTRIS